MRSLVLTLLFLVLLTNCLTLTTRPASFDVYTLDLALIPFATTISVWTLLQSNRRRFRLRGFDVLLLAVVALVLLSHAFSVDRVQSLSHAMDWLRLALLYFALRLSVPTLLGLQALGNAFTGLGVLLLLIGLLQMITGEPIGVVANYFGETLHEAPWSRVSGTTPNSNLYASWLIIYAGFPYVSTLARGQVVRSFVIWTLTLVVLLSTQSRGGVGGFLLLSIVALWLNRQQTLRPTFVLSGMIAATAFVLLVAISVLTRSSIPLASGVRTLYERQEQAGDFSREGLRRGLAAVGVQLLQDPKVALVGSGSESMIRAAEAAHMFLPPSVAELVHNVEGGNRTGVHNAWLATAVENGLPAAVALATMFSLLSIRLWRWRRRCSRTDPVWTTYLLAIAAWYILVASQIYLISARLPVLLPLVLIMAFFVSEDRESERVLEVGTSPLPWQPVQPASYSMPPLRQYGSLPPSERIRSPGSTT